MERKGILGFGSGEVRRIHIIYFLSRMGRIEQPHLIRVHHLNRKGVHLRDVKRWLSDLRGKDMPNSFSWSCKRRYKRGYVWQDLTDDDLITPISDSEYVLKGSTILQLDYYLCGDQERKSKSDDTKQQEALFKLIAEKPDAFSTTSSSTITLSPTNTEEEEEEEFSENSMIFTVDHGLIKPNSGFVFTPDDLEIKDLNEQVAENVKMAKLSQQQQQPSSSNVSFNNSNNMNRNKNKNKSNKSRIDSCGASSVFRNLFNCGAVDTIDSSMMTMNPRNNENDTFNGNNNNCTNNTPFTSKSKLKSESDSNSNNVSEICRLQRFSGSHPWNIFNNGISWRQQHHRTARKLFEEEVKPNEFITKKKFVYKPITMPKCSQCGKPFKPDRLYTHMKSCKGLKS